MLLTPPSWGFVQANFHTQITDAVFPIITYLGKRESFGLLYRWCSCLQKMPAVRSADALRHAGRLSHRRGADQEYCVPSPALPAISGICCHAHSAAGVLLLSLRTVPPPCRRHSAVRLLQKMGVSAFVLAFLIALSRVFLICTLPHRCAGRCGAGDSFGLLTLFVYRHAVRPKLNKRQTSDPFLLFFSICLSQRNPQSGFFPGLRSFFFIDVMPFADRKAHFLVFSP